MGNDDKMIIHKPELKLFLTDKMYPETKTEPEHYDLENEYEKTKQNKNHTVLLMLLALVALVVGISYGITAFIAYQNKKIDVDINVFADTNLIELFDMVSRTEDALASAQSEKARIEMLRQTELQEIEAKKEGELYALQSMRLTRAAQNQQEKEIQGVYEASLLAVQESYDRDLAVLEKSIEEYRKQLETLDSSRVKQAQEQQVALDFQRHIYEMEKVQLQEKYELIIQDLREKIEEQQRLAYERQMASIDSLSSDYQRLIALLDPIVEDPRVDEIKAEIAEFVEMRAFYADDYRISAENEVYNHLLEKIEHAYASIDYLAEIVSTIPYENSIPSILETIESIYYVIGIELAYFSSNEIASLQKSLDTVHADYEIQIAALEANYQKTLEDQRISFQNQLADQKDAYEKKLIVQANEFDKIVEDSRIYLLGLERELSKNRTYIEALEKENRDLKENQKTIETASESSVFIDLEEDDLKEDEGAIEYKKERNEQVSSQAETETIQSLIE
ncbi:MAG TPA: hypothetical protein VLZ44_07005 [Treponemataceae bacterium]|nr:hypothetical protein [Treponemataceae bacterium]